MSTHIIKSTFFFLILALSIPVFSQNCPTANLRKNSSCIQVVYGTAGEAAIALSSPEKLTITMSTGGSADGIYTASLICGTTTLVYTKNGSNSCNCNGYNGHTAGVFAFEIADVTCTYNADGSLPVEWKSFTGKALKRGIEIKWETESEINNEGFFLESSLTGKNFESIGFFNGQGSTSSMSQYATLDRTASTGYNYYRLKQIDFDGNFEYSEVIAIDYRANNQVYFRFDSSRKIIEIETQEKINKLVLFNLSGHQVKVWEDVNRSNSQLQLGNQEKGIYFLVGEARNGATFNYRFVIL